MAELVATAVGIAGIPAVIGTCISSAKWISRFIKGMRDLPHHVKRLGQEVGAIADILTRIKTLHYISASLENAISNCWEDLYALQKHLEMWQTKMQTSGYASRAKMVLDQDEASDLRETMMRHIHLINTNLILDGRQQQERQTQGDREANNEMRRIVGQLVRRDSMAQMAGLAGDGERVYYNDDDEDTLYYDRDYDSVGSASDDDGETSDGVGETFEMKRKRHEKGEVIVPDKHGRKPY